MLDYYYYYYYYRKGDFKFHADFNINPPSGDLGWVIIIIGYIYIALF